MKRLFLLPVLAVMLTAVVMLAGCEAQQSVSEDGMELVNAYLTGAGAEEMPPEGAAAMNRSLMQNTETDEIVSSWQLLVDYVRRVTSGEEPPSSYTVEAGPGSSVGFDMDNVWEHIGG